MNPVHSKWRLGKNYSLPLDIATNVALGLYHSAYYSNFLLFSSIVHHYGSEIEEGYDAIYTNIRSRGWRHLKGYFPTRRHGDYLRIYVDMMEDDLGW